MAGSISGNDEEGINDINVTPFVDVMLVLLIIFMVAAPLLQTGVDVELPEAKGQQLPSPKKEPVQVIVKANGDTLIGETVVPLDQLPDKLKAIAKNGYDDVIYVSADKSVAYGIVMRVMGRIQSSGFRKLAFVANDEKGG
jgi:biopolymer transport protein TolR